MINEILMLEEAFNSYYEIHAFMIAFVVSFIVFAMVTWAYERSSHESVKEELAILVLIAIGLTAFLYYIPDWVMQNNLYQEPHYALFGVFLGFVGSIVFVILLIPKMKEMIE